MISYLIVIVLIIISLVSIKRYRLLGFVLLIALIGSDTDSAGILYAIAKYVPGYKIIIRGITLILFVYSAFYTIALYLNGKIRKSYFFIYVLPLLLLSFIIFSVNIIRGVDIITALSEIIWLGIPIFFIWTVGTYKTKNSQEVFMKIIKYQAITTLAILLLGPYASEINGVSYAHLIGEDYWRTLSQAVINAKISIGEFTKHSLTTLKFAQFHNPNALGVYSTVYLAASLSLFINRKKIKNKLILSMFLLFVGMIGWFNSLTRGPIFLLFLILFFYLMGIIIKPKTYRRVFLLLIIGIISIMNLNSFIKVAQYFLINSSNISFTSRLGGYSFAIDTILTNPLLGIMPELSDPIPHILPLKIGSYYGLLALILVTIPFIHLLLIGSKVFLRDILNGVSEKSLFHMILVGIIFGAYLTNGVVVYVLFWILLSEALNKFEIMETSNNTKSLAGICQDLSN